MTAFNAEFTKHTGSDKRAVVTEGGGFPRPPRERNRTDDREQRGRYQMRTDPRSARESTNTFLCDTVRSGSKTTRTSLL